MGRGIMRQSSAQMTRVLLQQAQLMRADEEAVEQELAAERRSQERAHQYETDLQAEAIESMHHQQNYAPVVAALPNHQQQLQSQRAVTRSQFSSVMDELKKNADVKAKAEAEAKRLREIEELIKAGKAAKKSPVNKLRTQAVQEATQLSIITRSKAPTTPWCTQFQQTTLNTTNDSNKSASRAVKQRYMSISVTS